MDVYLVPVGAERYELYCEVPDHAEVEQLDLPDSEDQQEPRRGFIRRMRQRFRDMLAEAERERRQARVASGESEHGGWLARIRTRTLRWVAESIAEQRLLWHLRRQTEACLFYPDDMDEAQALTILRSQLRRDFDKHRFWVVIDALGFIGSGLLMLVPGPNLIAYYFAFRLVGHYLSLRGARQGLGGVQWRLQKSAPLSELRRAVSLEPEVRVRRVHEVAARLRLEHLVSFFERTAIPG